MLQITLADASIKKFSDPIAVLHLAQSISPGLAKQAVAARIDSQLVGLDYLIEKDATVTILTAKDSDALDVLRHSCAHLLAMAVKKLFPDTQIAIGPVIENGFYYDFATQTPFTTDDLSKIEKKMQHLAAQNYPIEHRVISLTEAKDFFKSQNETYKIKILANLPKDEDISCYIQGDFTDLCRGPHIANTSKIKHFKLTKLSGAYWRGDANNEMLQRIYGTCWFTQQDLTDYLFMLSEAVKRDHRTIGKKLNWFHTQEEAPGIVFWHPKGFTLYHTIEQYLRRLLTHHHYQEIKTPQILDQSLWEKSGHWDKFQDMMFTTHSEKRDYAIKPMNCPGHIQIFNQGIKSYRDLPLRLSEFGSCHRNEPSGTLHGLMRVRAFTQDDAHIFCSHDQIQTEVAQFIDLVHKVYANFGFLNVRLKLSTRPEQRVGSDEIWDKAEQSLQDALNSKQLDWELSPGEGAFYGPKIEFSLKDCLGRVWQCGTIQVDFSMPERLNAHYIAENGNKETPVMLHRAILGSFERFIGVLIEHYAGLLPCWLAPVQIAILSITQQQTDYCQKLAQKFSQHNLRTTIDLRNEKINFKIRHHSIEKIPYLLIIGDKEVKNRTVAVRSQSGINLGSLAIDEFIQKITAVIEAKSSESALDRN